MLTPSKNTSELSHHRERRSTLSSLALIALVTSSCGKHPAVAPASAAPLALPTDHPLPTRATPIGKTKIKEVYAISWSKAGDELAIAALDRVQILATATATLPLVRTYPWRDAALAEYAFVAATESKRSASVMSLADGRVLSRLHLKDLDVDDACSPLSLSQDGGRLGCGGGFEAQVYDVARKALIHESGFPGASPLGGAATLSASGRFIIWSESRQGFASTSFVNIKGEEQGFMSAGAWSNLSPDDRFIFDTGIEYTGDDPALSREGRKDTTLVAATSAKIVARLRPKTAPLGDNAYFATFCATGALVAFRVENGIALVPVRHPHERLVIPTPDIPLSFSPDGARLVTRSAKAKEAATITLWKLEVCAGDTCGPPTGCGLP